MGSGKPRTEKLIKELVAEDWCFLCKDGGFLRICDYKQCLKSYHPTCVGKDDSFLDGGDHWACDWHTCFLCRRSVSRHCYTCPKAVCHRCLPTADFLQVKGTNGFCQHCLKLALLVEENKDYDSDGKQVDFKDRETYEGLFKEYYLIIKESEGFELPHIYAAKDRDKARKQYKSGFESLEHDVDDDEDEEEVSDYDGSDHERTRKRKLKSAKKSYFKSNKKEFISWGSTNLIEFLGSIGKSTSEVLSQRDVTDIVNVYILEHKLLHPKKRKMVVCDERLRPLFGRRMISRNRIYDLLEDHFTENHQYLEETDLLYDIENTNESTYAVSKLQRKFDEEIESTKNKRELSVPQSVFASITVDNVKLVYLKRSLLYELLKHPESFEEKVIGCFVRVKSDPYDYCTKNSHQLMQVKGIKSVSNGESNTEVVICFSAFPKEVHISILSDKGFSEEECADLRQKMLAGLLMKPTVGELQQKARDLHEDLTKHWINEELALLQKLIDQANEKGWRREYPFLVFTLFGYLEKRKRLQTPSEQARLLATFPIVSPEISEVTPNYENSTHDVKNDGKSIIQSASIKRWEENVTPEKGHRGHGKFPESKQPLHKRSGSGESQGICIPDHEFKPFRPASEDRGHRFESCHSGIDSQMYPEETWYEQTGKKSEDASTFEDLSSRRARLQRLEGLAVDVDSSFSDAGTSTSSQPVRCIPSMESLFFAKTAVRNFLELGLHQLGESQRLAMVSAVSILRASPDFSSEYPLLDSVATIFSDSDAAQAMSTSLLAKLEDFHSKRHRVEEMEQEGLIIHAQIKERTVEFDASEGEVKKLEEQIVEHRAKMALLLDEAEALEKKLVSYQREAKLAAGELVGLKDKYNNWTQGLRASEEKQRECLLKWEQLRRLFS
ncbi:hypothetical protein F511_20326 [Dorcoceras hygrometricum]|uniref:Uncharacterized protein n=1 Tax=Dorcoceras hygrometricum TaxID=472368 RepID=A0A2Z7CN53_9LAMI|nr:hypothetical protein F511_20326 [Dorcoceras hygrometricum]